MIDENQRKLKNKALEDLILFYSHAGITINIINIKTGVTVTDKMLIDFLMSKDQKCQVKYGGNLIVLSSGKVITRGFNIDALVDAINELY